MSICNVRNIVFTFCSYFTHSRIEWRLIKRMIEVYLITVLLLASVEIAWLSTKYGIDGSRKFIKKGVLDLNGPLSLTVGKTNILLKHLTTVSMDRASTSLVVIQKRRSFVRQQVSTRTGLRHLQQHRLSARWP